MYVGGLVERSYRFLMAVSSRKVIFEFGRKVGFGYVVYFDFMMNVRM